ncbi:MAG TPA: family 2A encapsulin nanocompartment cargo protein cysteine desulfurase, partial [Propioniciclava sp.]|uniref:family 2A encapsulin nanocompartment cargo protein cysteine desulfurase n=1 Tax=Propioniciclava sp. TaxID=2038686 RepID=UPI002CFFF5B0
PRDDLFDLGDARRSGGLPAGTLGSREVFDVGSIRKDFPILSEQVHGRPLIWFDNAATTQKPQAVIDRLAYFYAHENSNIHRAAHELAARATDAYEDARETVRDFLGAGRSEEIVFVRGATEGINLVAQSWGRANLRAGDEILITNLEHHANIVPWQIVAQQTGAVLKVAPVDDRGNLLLDAFTALLDPRTKLVAATQVANATGTVNPVQTLTALAHRAGARVLIDGAQSVPHLGVDLQSLDADFFVFSGHKVFGPTGIGAVFISERVWEETPAWQGGGNMIADVTIERSIYQGPPNKYEAGTGNIADAVGLAAALRYVNEVGIERIAAYEHSLLEYATPKLAAIPGVRLIGTATEKASVLSFVLAGHEPEAVGTALNERGIAVRAGHHCAQPILRRLGVEKTVRPSFAFYNTAEEIDVFLDAVHDLSEQTAATP